MRLGTPNLSANVGTMTSLTTTMQDSPLPNLDQLEQDARLQAYNRLRQSIPVKIIGTSDEGMLTANLPDSFVDVTKSRVRQVRIPVKHVAKRVELSKLIPGTWVEIKIKGEPSTRDLPFIGRLVNILDGSVLNELLSTFAMAVDDEQQAHIDHLLQSAREAESMWKVAAEEKRRDVDDQLAEMNVTRVLIERADAHGFLERVLQLLPAPEAPSPRDTPFNFVSLRADVAKHLELAGHNVTASTLNQALLSALTAALTGQLVLLAGSPGTGKTSLAAHLAAALDGCHSVIPVRPAWMEATDLLGHYSARHGQYQPTPFLEAFQRALAHEVSGRLHFVTLDEMNLSRIEDYGADLLSQMEKAHQSTAGGQLQLYAQALADHVRRQAFVQAAGGDPTAGAAAYVPTLLHPPQLRVPQNLVLFGTLNTDETTEALSPKVLDRAFVIRVERPTLNERSLHAVLRAPSGAEDPPAARLHTSDLHQATTAAVEGDLAPMDSVWSNLLKWQVPSLHKVGVTLSYRTELTFAHYAAVATLLGIDAAATLDAFVCSKVLPAISFLRHEESQVNALRTWQGELKSVAPHAAAAVQGMLDDTRDLVEYLHA